MARLHVVVLAAGKGTRMESDLAKVLHRVHGRPLVSWVLDATHGLGAASTTVVVGHQADDVAAVLPTGVDTVLQVPQNGTGHAADIAAGAIDPDDDDLIVVLPGDMPLISVDTLMRLAAAHDEETTAVVVSSIVEDPHGYGRVLRDDEDRVVAIVEELDASDTQRAIAEINTSVYSITAGPMRRALASIGDDNAQGEQYLTDVVGWLASEGHLVKAIVAPAEEGMGVNTVAQLRAVGSVLERREASSSQDQPKSLR